MLYLYIYIYIYIYILYIYIYIYIKVKAKTTKILKCINTLLTVKILKVYAFCCQ